MIFDDVKNSLYLSLSISITVLLYMSNLWNFFINKMNFKILLRFLHLTQRKQTKIIQVKPTEEQSKITPNLFDHRIVFILNCWMMYSRKFGLNEMMMIFFCIFSELPKNYLWLTISKVVLTNLFHHKKLMTFLIKMIGDFLKLVTVS